ncbi:MAG: isoaspartyl peptidase/L-asparaginase [Acidobacteriaceae bacterium]
MPANTRPVLLVHGGAWAIPDSMLAAHRAGVINARNAGWEILANGGSSLEAVEAAVSVLEDDDTFDAGRGSFLTSEGHVQCDALMMCGATLRAGGVGCVERVKNPVQAARLVLEKSPHVYFVGSGAEDFVQSLGIELIDNSELILDRERERLELARARAAAGLIDPTFSGEHAELPPEFSSHDTVGAVALDTYGNLAAATSTGGTLNKTPGRIGDSSLIGCGCYADNDSAATSLTGWGEPIMKLVLGKWACDRVLQGAAPHSAAHDAITYLSRRLLGHGGIILLDRRGNIGLSHNTPRMAWALRTSTTETAGCHRRDLNV